jgi:hypothetical protein
MLYDTLEKKMAFISTKGNIVTFKSKQYLSSRAHSQLIVDQIQNQENKVRILGLHVDSIWFDDLNQLIAAIDWPTMELWHTD